MEVICLQDEAFYNLIHKVIEKVIELNSSREDKWISGEEVMKKLHIKSKTTLQKLRDTGAIRFSQPEKKLIFYDITSIDDYLEKSAKEPF